MSWSLLKVCCWIPLVRSAIVLGALSLQLTLSNARSAFEFQ